MHHARPDYNVIQDNATAVKLARLVLNMHMTQNAQPELRRLALAVMQESSEQQVITTNGTTRVIPADEPVFLLRAQDALSAETVRYWADMAEERGVQPEIVAVAREHAEKMDAWPHKKLPDLPVAEGTETN